MTPPDDAMTTPTDGSGCLVLDREQCLAYLAAGGLGRIAVNVGALPAILPVHFALDGEHVVFSIGAGTTLDRATRDAVVAFESDGHEPNDGMQWSVMVTGVARHLPVDGDRWRAALADLPAWAGADARHVVAVSTDYVSGRRTA
jgi:nitroimidazol reductase NimA-like FMN-containing flavoprotein (pyridoxamine 5'-phosphate oxidase superfamily)